MRVAPPGPAAGTAVTKSTQLTSAFSSSSRTMSSTCSGGTELPGSRFQSLNSSCLPLLRFCQRWTAKAPRVTRGTW